MSRRSTHGQKIIASSGSGLMTSAMALSASHHAAGKRSGSSPASRGNDDLAADEPKKRIKEVLGIREEEQRQRSEWEDAMQAVATSLASDYPLLDLPLILSLISDLNPAELASSKSSQTALEDIRETLAILQAGMVPDDEEGFAQHVADQTGPSTSGAVESSDDIASLSRTQGQAFGSPLAPSGTSESVPPRAGSGKEGKPLDAGRSSSASAEPTLRTPGILAISAADIKKSTHSPQVDYSTDQEHDSDLERIMEDLRVQRNESDQDQVMDVFLMEMFEYLPHLTILDAITRATSPSGHVDVVRAIDDLVSQERIRDVQERGTWEDDQNGTTGSTAEEDEEHPMPDDPLEPSQIETPRRSSGTTTPALPSPSTPKLSLTTPIYSRLGRASPSVPRSNNRTSNANLAPKPVQIIKQETVGSRYPSISTDRASSGSASSASEDESGSETTSIRSRGRRGRAKPTPLVDILQRRDINAQTSHRMDGSAMSSTPPLASQPSPNTWHTFISLASAMEHLLHEHNPKATSGLFLSYFHSQSYISAYAAMKAALESLMIPRAAVENALLMAAEIMGVSQTDAIDLTSMDARKDLQVCVRASRGDVGVALDLCSLLQEVRGWQGESNHLAETVASHSEGQQSLRNTKITPKPCVNSQTALTAPSTFAPSPQKAENGEKARRKVEHPQNWRTVTKAKTKRRTVDHPLAEYIPSYSRGATPHDATPGSLFTDPSEKLAIQSIYDLNVCRKRAAEQRRRREEAMRQAGKYFKVTTKNNSAGSGYEVAAFYAAEARRYEQEARMWELRAAREIVKKQSAHHDKFCIDIHHLTLAEATTVVLESVTEWHASQNFAPSPAKPFQIITGVGKHSPNHVGILLPAIANVLERNGWKADRGHSGRGYLLVRGVTGS